MRPAVEGVDLGPREAVAVLLNLAFNHIGRGNRADTADTAATGHGAPDPAPVPAAPVH
ncbi:hypothetical protein [Streptomyces sp. NPDC091371]|uniref:hypothetical protein n=1 Tax=Streptomyces sp. NPDC091371 TaxID=3155303 RepID=UPI00343420A7